MIRAGKQSGYILMPVIVVITLVAAIALLMNTESALESNTAGSELEAQQAQYVAEAGMSHALWRAQQQGCGPYSDLIGQPLDDDKYTTKLTTDLGSTTGYSTLVDQDSWIRSNNPSDNNAADTSLHVGNDGGNIERPLLRYDFASIPSKAAILSATAWFYVDREHPEGSVDIHRITADWTETDATWDSMGDKHDSTVLATIPAQPANDVWVSVNLTAQVQAWVNGEPNYGITLNTISVGVDAEYASRESANAPYLEILVGVPPTSPATLKSVGTLANGITRALINDDVTLVQQPGFVQLQPDAVDGKDAEIWDQAPNNNYGNADETWVSSAHQRYDAFTFAIQHGRGTGRFANSSGDPVARAPERFRGGPAGVGTSNQESVERRLGDLERAGNRHGLGRGRRRFRQHGGCDDAGRPGKPALYMGYQATGAGLG